MCSSNIQGEWGNPRGRLPRSLTGRPATALSKVKCAPPPSRRYSTCSRTAWSVVIEFLSFDRRLYGKDEGSRMNEGKPLLLFVILNSECPHFRFPTKAFTKIQIQSQLSSIREFNC